MVSGDMSQSMSMAQRCVCGCNCSEMAQCGDCGCNCSQMEESISGKWFQSMKQKCDRCEDSVFSIPGFVLPLTARIGMENECAALREMVSTQQQSIQDLTIELDAERNASSSAANEAMSMILRLEREKAEVQMEFTQFKRFAEEKMVHDEQEISSFEDLLYKREQVIQALTCEVQMYKHRMMSLGFTESEVEAEIEKERSRISSDNTVSETSNNGQNDLPLYDYPPLKCLNENQVYFEADNEDIDVEKYAFGETPRSRDHFLDLETRINHLERSPRISHPDGEFYKNNVLEKVIVGQSPRRPRHLKKFSADSSGFFVTNKEMNCDFVTESPRFGGSFRKTEFSQRDEYSNLRKMDSASEYEDCMSDRIYTIDSIHLGAAYNVAPDPKASVGICQDYITTPRDSVIYTNTEDVDIKKLYARLHALEADRESMRQALISMSTDKSQVILLKEIAQQLCKDMARSERAPVTKPSSAGSFSVTSIFKWMLSFVLWRKKARRCKYMFGLTANNVGLLLLLDRGPRVGPWRCLLSTQV